MIPFFSSKIFRVFPQLCFRFSPRLARGFGGDLFWDGGNSFALVLLFNLLFLCVIFSFTCYKLVLSLVSICRFAVRAVSSCQGVFAVLEKIPRTVVFSVVVVVFVALALSEAPPVDSNNTLV